MQSSVHPLHRQPLLICSHRGHFLWIYQQAADMPCSAYRCMSQSEDVQLNGRLVKLEPPGDKLQFSHLPHIRFQDLPANRNSAGEQRTTQLCCVNLYSVVVRSPLFLRRNPTQPIQIRRLLKNPQTVESSRFCPCHNLLMCDSGPISA